MEKKLKKEKEKKPAPVGIPFSEMPYIFILFFMWHPAGTNQISIGYHGILRHLTVGITPQKKIRPKNEKFLPKKKQLLVTSDLLVTSGMIYLLINQSEK